MFLPWMASPNPNNPNPYGENEWDFYFLNHTVEFYIACKLIIHPTRSHSEFVKYGLLGSGCQRQIQRKKHPSACVERTGQSSSSAALGDDVVLRAAIVASSTKARKSTWGGWLGGGWVKQHRTFTQETGVHVPRVTFPKPNCPVLVPRHRNQPFVSPPTIFS